MKKLSVLFGGVIAIAVISIGVGTFLWINHQKDAEFLRSVRPIILDFASFYNDTIEKETGTITYGETLDFSKSAIEKLNGLNKTLLELRSPNKSCDKIVSDMVGVLSLTKSYQFKRLQQVQYFLDASKMEDQLASAATQNLPSLKQQYESKKESLSSLTEKEIPALANQLTTQASLFLYGNEKRFNYDTKTIVPALNRKQYLSEEEKKKFEQVLELPPKASGSDRYVCLVDAVRAFGALYNMHARGKRNTETNQLGANDLRYSIQQVDLAQRLMDRSMIPGAESYVEKKDTDLKDAHLSMSKLLVAEFKKPAEQMKIVLTEYIEWVESVAKIHPNAKDAEKILKNLNEKQEGNSQKMLAAWKAIYFSSLPVPYILVTADEDGTRLALSIPEGKKLLALIKECFGDEITKYESGVIEYGDKYDGLSAPAYAGMLMIYKSLNEFLQQAKLQEQGIKQKDLTWEQTKELGLYRNGSQFDKYCFRDAFYQMQPKDEKASDEEKTKKREEFLATHPL